MPAADLRLRRRARRHRAVRAPAGVQPDVRRVRPAGALVRGGLRAEAADRRRQGADGQPAHPGVRRGGRAADRPRRARTRRSRPGTGARPRSTRPWSPAGQLPARPGIRRIIAEAADAGWRLAVASTSAEPSVRAVLEHAVGPELRPGRRGLRRRHRAGARSRPRTSTSWPSGSWASTRSGRSWSRTAATGCCAALGAGLPCVVTVNALHRRTRTSPAPRSSSARSATRRRAGHGAGQPDRAPHPATSSTLTDLEACMARTEWSSAMSR